VDWRKKCFIILFSCHRCVQVWCFPLLNTVVYGKSPKWLLVETSLACRGKKLLGSHVELFLLKLGGRLLAVWVRGRVKAVIILIILEWISIDRKHVWSLHQTPDLRLVSHVAFCKSDLVLIGVLVFKRSAERLQLGLLLLRIWSSLQTRLYIWKINLGDLLTLSSNSLMSSPWRSVVITL